MIIIVFLSFIILIHQSGTLYSLPTPPFFELQLDSKLHSIFTCNYDDESGYSSLGFAKNSNGEMVYMEPDPSNDRIRKTSEECFCFREVSDPPLTDEYLLSLNIGWDLIIKARTELEEK